MRRKPALENEVCVSKSDKQKLIEIATEAKQILGKYPYESISGYHTVTTMMRAKGAAKESLQWFRLLDTIED